MKMKKKVYEYGPHKCKAYFKSAGKGWEVGFHFGNKPIFVGNFIHKAEANKWWTLMNKEVRTFSKRFGLHAKAPITFYRKFFSNHLYNNYYAWLDKEFNRYEKNYLRAVNSGKKEYSRILKTKKLKKSETYPLKKVA